MNKHSCKCTWVKAPHSTWGACQRGKNIRIAYCRDAAGYDKTRQDRWDAELNAYRDARRQGIQPDGTTMDQVRAAVEASNIAGEAYQG